MNKIHFLFFLLVLLLIGCTEEKTDNDRIEVYDKKTNELIQTISNQKVVNQFVKEIEQSEGISFHEDFTYPYRITIYKDGKKATFDYTARTQRPSILLVKNGGDIDHFIPEKYFDNAEKSVLNANIFYVKMKLPMKESGQ